MLPYGEADIHYMDSFHLQNVASRTRTCPRTGLSMIGRGRPATQIGSEERTDARPNSGRFTVSVHRERPLQEIPPPTRVVLKRPPGPVHGEPRFPGLRGHVLFQTESLFITSASP